MPFRYAWLDSSIRFRQPSLSAASIVRCVVSERPVRQRLID